MSSDRTETVSAAAEVTLNREQALELFDDQTPVIARIGGFGSGKSFSDVLLWLDRSNFDTGQRHGFFANTEQQAIEGIFPDLEPWLEAANIEYVFGTKPPRKWVRRWERDGVPYPSRGPRSRATLILETGLHVVFFGLANNKYKRAKGYQFGSIIIEEVTELPSPWVIDYFLIPRNRCGLGAFCREAGHRHQTYLRGNPPPPEQPHWIRSWIRDKLDAEKERRETGKPPFFRYFRSSTADNPANPTDYIDTLYSSMDPLTAAALIEGDLTEALIARTYHGFTDKNKARVPYDRNKPVFVSFDFNVEPSVATLGQELDPSDVPAEHRKTGVVYQGTFGMIFDRRGLDAGQLMTALVEGKLGTWPENFKGLIEHNDRVIVYGDATGGMRRVEAVDRGSAWKWIHAIGNANLGRRYVVMVPRSNPSTFERVGVFNAFANPARGVVRYFVDREFCKPLIRDFENVVPPKDGSEAIDKSMKDKTLTHASDAETYKIFSRYGNSLRPQMLRSLRSLPERGVLKPLANRTPYDD